MQKSKYLNIRISYGRSLGHFLDITQIYKYFLGLIY